MLLAANKALVRRLMGHHPEFCVKKRLFKKVHLRGYYRHRQSLENILPIFQKGGCYACFQAQAYHIVP